MEGFRSEQAREVVKYAREKYGDELEFLWPKFPKNAILRNRLNQKWYAAMLAVGKNKLGLDSEEEVEILDLRFYPHEALAFAEENNNVYPGYHMNKGNWITVILDGSMETEKILGLVDLSYEVAAKA